MRSIAEKIMEAIEEDVQKMMCRDCPHAEFIPATFYDPPQAACPGDFEPWDGGCKRHDEYEEIEEEARELEKDIQVIIFGMVCAKCQP